MANEYASDTELYEYMKKVCEEVYDKLQDQRQTSNTLRECAREADEELKLARKQNELAMLAMQLIQQMFDLFGQKILSREEWAEAVELSEDREKLVKRLLQPGKN